MNDHKRKRMAELQRQSDDQDRQAEERDREHTVTLLDALLAPAADAVTASTTALAEQLAELDLIS
jgi:DNA-binding TFAR19-related protein (PDSD5 family)